MNSRQVFAALLATLTLLLLPSAARAATLTPACSSAALVSAFTTAEGNGEADTITLAKDCDYKIATPASVDLNYGNSALPPHVQGDLVVHGNGATIEHDPASGRGRSGSSTYARAPSSSTISP